MQLYCKLFNFFSGKVARSKPILQRLTSNKIKSVYNHIYILDGNIVDDRNGK